MLRLDMVFLLPSILTLKNVSNYIRLPKISANNTRFLTDILENIVQICYDLSRENQEGYMEHQILDKDPVKSYYTNIYNEFWNRPLQKKDLEEACKYFPDWIVEVIGFLRIAARFGFYTPSECDFMQKYAISKKLNPFFESPNDRATYKILAEKYDSMSLEEYL